jgi:hypothetical protein
MPTTQTKRPRGRPKTGARLAETWQQIAMLLDPQQVAALDRLADRRAQRTRKPCNRTDLIREAVAEFIARQKEGA